MLEGYGEWLSQAVKLERKNLSVLCVSVMNLLVISRQWSVVTIVNR